MEDIAICWNSKFSSKHFENYINEEFTCQLRSPTKDLKCNWNNLLKKKKRLGQACTQRVVRRPPAPSSRCFFLHRSRVPGERKAPHTDNLSSYHCLNLLTGFMPPPDPVCLHTLTTSTAGHLSLAHCIKQTIRPRCFGTVTPCGTSAVNVSSSGMQIAP